MKSCKYTDEEGIYDEYSINYRLLGLLSFSRMEKTWMWGMLSAEISVVAWCQAPGV
jgi:hypothetical protein